MAFLGYQDTMVSPGPWAFSVPVTTSAPLVVTDKEQRLLRNMSPAQIEYVGELKSAAAQAEHHTELERRRAMAKGQEAIETVGTAAGLGFVRGYYPDWKPLGFNPSLLLGAGAHAGALYVAEDAHKRGDAKMLEHERSLEHVGNGALSAYAFEEMADVARRLKATKAAQQAAAVKSV